MAEDISRHNDEIQKNLAHWNRKPLLRRAYADFHSLIAQQVRRDIPGLRVELGSGIGNIRDFIPDCLRTDIFANPWLDRVENAYRLSFPDASVSNLIMFDVFHHLRYPGTALAEIRRVLAPGGRLIILDPCVSAFGLLVYGPLHPEPLALGQPIEWMAPDGWSPDNDTYYAAQGNAFRIFVGARFRSQWSTDWSPVAMRRLSALSYIVSGGYSRPQMIPLSLYPVVRAVDAILSRVPFLFATRLLVVLERA